MRERLRVTVRGVVQGVGFRPFVYRLALGHGLAGFVRNTGDGVLIEAEGDGGVLAAFLRELNAAAPPLVGILTTDALPVQVTGEEGFSIADSCADTGRSPFVPPDIAICGQCLRELFDPADRRFRYPFINCTNCGPRFTIIRDMPYDRPLTSMSVFAMCSSCRNEYEDPADRRFHAQPNACGECGPQVSLLDPVGGVLAVRGGAIEAAARLLRVGKIVAIKGVGGFHLAVDAGNQQAVVRLRQRKGRAEKPLAVMVRDLEQAGRFCRINEDEARLLASPQRPIVLLRRRGEFGPADGVAPGCRTVGVMLAYAPLHHLLFAAGPELLVMTSANLSEEPIAIGNEEAITRLGAITDALLIHDREILLRCDDSVAQVVSGLPRLLRRARGYVPLPVNLGGAGATVLGAGAELKSAVCLLKGGQAFVGPHVGDLKNPAAYSFFKDTAAQMLRLFDARLELVAHDLHPDYLSTRWAREQEICPAIAVQHHHAHLAACMAENGIAEPVVGLIMDGAGHGEDGTVWGGEILAGDARGYSRIGHFEAMPLPGGDAAVRAPWRTAVAYLRETYGEGMPELPFLERHDWAPVAEMAAARFNTPLTSSCGRFFDAIAAMAGGRPTIAYEAQAAVEFMEAADHAGAPAFSFELSEAGGMLIMPVREIVRGIARAVLAGTGLPAISAGFHLTLARLFARAARRAVKNTGLRHVVLSGGVFQNRLLLKEVLREFGRENLSVFTHSRLPAGDGCISTGQALIGRAYCGGI